jgi:2,4-dienoyl-CoA reductase-like NADH-dependent reductase (Old Yellow Enzyme family)
MPPMATSKSEKDGKVSQSILDYYEDKSKGGYISLIIIEHSFITQAGKASNNQLSIADDSVVDSLKILAETIHKNGTKAVMQINHAGSAANAEVTGLKPAGPSEIKNPRTGNVPKELTREEIKNIVEEFRSAAIRTKAAGFDGVEIHSAHGYLLNQFFSPLTNKRADEYGGDILRRIKIHLDIIKAIRGAVGKEFTILLRLAACDYMEGGITVEHSQVAAREFEKAGIDILDISGGFNGYTIPGVENVTQGYFYPLTEAIKNQVSIPVILTGGITDVNVAEELLEENKADLIGIGRAIYRDSNWVRNAVESLK